MPQKVGSLATYIMVREMLKEQVKHFLEAGVSLKAIAATSQVHYTTLSKWMNNERELNQPNQERVAAALETIVNKLTNILIDR